MFCSPGDLQISFGAGYLQHLEKTFAMVQHSGMETGGRVKASRFPSSRRLNHDKKHKTANSDNLTSLSGGRRLWFVTVWLRKKKSRGWTSKTTVTSGRNRKWGGYNHWSTSLPLMPCYWRTWYIYHSGRLKRLTLSLLLFSPYYLYVHMPSSGALL